MQFDFKLHATLLCFGNMASNWVNSIYVKTVYADFIFVTLIERW